jgi:hypothetical protein
VLPGGPNPVPPPMTNGFLVAFTNDVPEAATWTMLIAGFGLTGAMARRRRGVALAGLA